MKMFILFFLLSFTINAAIQPQDARLTNFKYPYSVSFFTLDTLGEKVEMAYMDLKPENSNGKTFVLLHGKNFSGFYFEKIANSLLKKGFRVVIPDQIGFGKSTKPVQFQYSFHRLGEMTHRLLEYLKVDKFSILGHSMGGMLAARISLMYPEQVEKLVMLCPLGLEDYKKYVPYKNIDEILTSELKSTPDSIREYQRNNYYSGTWKDEYETLITPAAGQTLHSDFNLVARNSALTFEMIYTQPVIYELSLLKVPTTLIVGLNDKTAPGKPSAKPVDQKKMGDFTKLGKAAKKIIPRLNLIELKGRGHVPFLEAWDEFEKIIIDQF